MSDLLIKNGIIIDGTGSEPFAGHVCIKKDKIDTVERADTPEGDQLLQKGASEVFDAKGLAVTPGFIDCHTHFDWVFPLAHHPDFLFPMIEQGVTTVVSGNCGFSPVPVTQETTGMINEYARFLMEEPLAFEWEEMRGFLDYLRKSGGLLFNNAQLVGHGATQIVATKSYNAQPDEDQVKQMEAMINDALEQGAFGLSYGLMYPPEIFSTQKELAQMARLTSKKGRILTVHIKALSKYSGSYPLIPFIGRPHNLKALDEILTLAQDTGVKLQISHFLFAGTKSWAQGDKAIRMIEKAKDRGVKVMWDIYPHFCGNSYLTIFLPSWFIQDLDKNMSDQKALKKLRFELKLAKFFVGFEFANIQIMKANYPEGEKYNGMNLVEIGKREGLDPIDTMLKMVKESEGQTLQLTYGYSGDDDHEELIEKLMAHELCLFETDTLLLSKGFPNPASYGAFPRILGHFVRDKKALSLTDAIHRMTGKTAKWYGIKDRGEIKSGNFADVVLFNPDTIADNTTIKQTNQKPAGIEKVIVNGEMVVMDGCYLKGKKAGRVLKYE